MLIPRGGKGLISRLMAEATVPMIKHLNGICHTYVDAVLIWKWRLALLIMPRPNAHLPAMPRKHSWFIAMKRSRFCR